MRGGGRRRGEKEWPPGRPWHAQGGCQTLAFSLQIYERQQPQQGRPPVHSSLGLGQQRCCRPPAVVVTLSLGLELTLKGVAQEAASLLVFFRLWKYTPEFMRVARHGPEVRAGCAWVGGVCGEGGTACACCALLHCLAHALLLCCGISPTLDRAQDAA